MAITLFEDAPHTPRQAAVAGMPILDARKLAIWIVSGAVSWGIVIGALRLAVAALG